MTKEEKKYKQDSKKRQKKERKIGRAVKVGYRKLTINGKIWLWDGKTRKLVPKNSNQ